VFGDQACWKEDDRQFLESWGIGCRINRHPTARRTFRGRWRLINRARPRTRVCGEHAYRVVKQLWGFTKAIAACTTQRADLSATSAATQLKSCGVTQLAPALLSSML